MLPLRCLFAALLCLLASAKETSFKTSSEGAVGSSGTHTGPYSPIANMLEDKRKKSAFYQVSTVALQPTLLWIPPDCVSV